MFVELDVVSPAATTAVPGFVSRQEAMWQRFFILLLCVANSKARQRPLNKVYSLEPLCDPDSDSYDLTNGFDEKFIREKLVESGADYGEIVNCSTLLVCNEWQESINASVGYKSLSTIPRLESCPKSTSYSVAFEDQRYNPLTTVFISDVTGEYFDYFYFHCINYITIQDHLIPNTSYGQAFGVYYEDYGEEEGKVIQVGINATGLELRPWDFTGNCHSRLYNQSELHPIGLAREEKGSVALFCHKDFNCSQLMKSSEINIENPIGVDFSFRQDQCINTAHINGDLKASEADLSEEHAGQFSCLDACRGLDGGYNLALINNLKCLCVNYDRLNASLETFISDACQPCNNASFTCGSGSFTSVYHVDTAFGTDLGFKYWNCVNRYPFNNPHLVLNGDSYKKIESVGTATECLSHCKEDGYGLAMLTNWFECICMSPEKYRFSSSDLSMECTEVR